MRGFSLIEAIIYIALLGFLMAGSIASAYQITQNSHLLSGKNTVQEEGSFVLRKVDHAFAGARDITVSGTTLTIYPYIGSNIVFTLSGTSIFVNRGAGSKALTTDNVSVDSFVLSDHAGPPKGVSMTLTINGVEFESTNYVR